MVRRAGPRPRARRRGATILRKRVLGVFPPHITLSTPAIAAPGGAAAAIVGRAGPLNPPAGPIARTHQTLTEVEPRIPISAATRPGDADSLFRITQPGSYYVTGNITGVAAKHGIEIEASNVTLDLMGFAFIGVAGSLNGVNVRAFPQSVVIRNGSASGWGESGVDAILAANSLLCDLLCADNGLDGIRAGPGFTHDDVREHQDRAVSARSQARRPPPRPSPPPLTPSLTPSPSHPPPPA